MARRELATENYSMRRTPTPTRIDAWALVQVPQKLPRFEDVFVDDMYINGVVAGKAAITKPMGTGGGLQSFETEVGQTIEPEVGADLLDIHAVGD